VTKRSRRVVLTLATAMAWTALTAALWAQRLAPSHDASGGLHPIVTEVARVSGVALMSDRLEAAMNALLPQQAFHRSVGAKQIADVRKKALNTMIDEELEYQDGVRLGGRVTAADVDAAVVQARKKYPSPQAFDAALRRAGVTMADVRRELGRSLIVEKTLARQVTAKCGVTVDEAARYFADHPDRFVVPEQLHLFAITLNVDPSGGPRQWADTKSRAEDILRRIRAGASFDLMARQYSTDPSRTSGGDMGFMHRGSLNDAFEKAARDQAPGRVSDVIQTLYGYHIVRVAGVKPPGRKAFADVGADVRKELEAKRCEETKTAWIARLRAQSPIVIAAAYR
jgi:peptidyl-prolyl cis-trans isomerase C